MFKSILRAFGWRLVAVFLLFFVGVNFEPAFGEDRAVPNKELKAGVKVFSIIKETKRKEELGWVEEFYVVNDGSTSQEVVGVLSTLLTMEDGKVVQKIASAGVAGASDGSGKLAMKLEPGDAWCFSSLTYGKEPRPSGDGGTAEVTFKSGEKYRQMSIIRYRCK